MYTKTIFKGHLRNYIANNLKNSYVDACYYALRNTLVDLLKVPLKFLLLRQHIRCIEYCMLPLEYVLVLCIKFVA